MSERARSFCAVVCALVFVLPGLATIWFDEPFPAPIGPQFDSVPDDGRAYVLPRPQAYLEMPDGSERPVELIKILGIYAAERELVPIWIDEQRMSSAEDRVWLRDRIALNEDWRGARALILRVHEQRVDKRTLERDEPRLVAERRWDL